MIGSLQRRLAVLNGDRSSLRGRIVRGTFWVTTGHVAEIAFRLGSSLILTRLLTPSAFGIMATAQVFLFTAIMISDVGIRALVITHERPSDRSFIRTIWTFQFGRGIVLAILVALFGQLLGFAQNKGWIVGENSFAEPTLPALISVLGITLAIDGLKSANEHMMVRELRQNSLVALEIGSKFIETILKIAAVWITESVWGLAYALILSSVVRSALSLLFIPGERMGFHWDKVHAAFVISRGKWIGVSSWASMLGNVSDKVLIGAFFGSNILGLYTLAWTIGNALHNLLAKVAESIVFPTVRELVSQPVKKFRKKYFRVRDPFQVVGAVFGMGLAIGGPYIVSLAYDPRYEYSGVILSILSLRYLVFHLRVNSYVLRAKVQFARLAAYNLISVIGVSGAALIFANLRNLEAVVFAVSMIQSLGYLLVSRRLIQTKMVDRAGEIGRHLITVLSVVAVVMLVRSA